MYIAVLFGGIQCLYIIGFNGVQQSKGTENQMPCVSIEYIMMNKVNVQECITGFV